MTFDPVIFVLALSAGLGLGLAAWRLSLAGFAALSARLEPFLKRRRQDLNDLPLAVKRAMALRVEEAEGLPPWAKDWLRLVSKRLDRAGVGIPVGRYVLGIILGAITGMIVGIGFLNNFPAAVALAAAAFLVPDAVLAGRIQARRKKLIEQLGAAVRLFAAEFSDTPQVLRALARTAPKVPAPLGKVLQRAVSDLTAGQDKDEVLARLMKDLDFEYGRMFVQLLRLAWDDAAIKPLFSRLAVRIGGLQKLMQENQAQTAYGRWMSLAVNFMTLPMFFMSRAFVPGAGEFLTHHPAGRLLVFFTFASVLAGLLVDRLLTEVDV